MNQDNNTCILVIKDVCWYKNMDLCLISQIPLIFENYISESARRGTHA